jgi:hypothetical protein
VAIKTTATPIPSMVRRPAATPPVRPSADPSLNALAAGLGFSIPSANTPSAKPAGPAQGATGLEMSPQPNVIRRV